MKFDNTKFVYIRSLLAQAALAQAKKTQCNPAKIANFKDNGENLFNKGG